MGDIAAILGASGDMTLMGGPPPPAPSSASLPRALKLQGLSKEVTDVMTSTRRRGGIETSVNSDLPMAVPASNMFARSVSSSMTQLPLEKRGAVVKVGNKWISASKPARKWVWAPFSSSARTDGLLLHHWVRNVEYPDYPYARFDIHLDPVTYNNDEEYRTHLKDPDWTKGETDQLLQLAKRFELRWPVIYDRWVEFFQYGCTSDIDTPRRRNIEDLQHRFYTVAATLLQLRIKHEATTEAQNLAEQTATAAASAATADVGRSMDDSKRATDALLIETAAARALASTELLHQPVMHHIGTGTTNKVAFDLNYERERRAHLEALWNRTKEEEAEEAELRKELKLVEAQLRKLKKAGAHIAADGGGGGGLTSAVSSRNASRAGTPVQFSGTISTSDVPSMLTQAFAASIPTATAGTPYLQSGRLLPPLVGGGSGINKALRVRMDEVLKEMNIKEQPLPTKRVCDLYDTVRKDILTLLILQRTALQKEGLLASQRLQLAKRGGKAQVVDEEALLGIQAALTGMPALATSSNRTSHGAKTARSGSKLGKTNPSSVKAKATSTKPKSSNSEGTSLAGAEARKDATSTAASATTASPTQNATTRTPAVTTTVSGVKQVRKGSAPGVKRKRNAAAAPPVIVPPLPPPPISQKSPVPIQTVGPTGNGLGRPVSAVASVGAEHGSGMTLNPATPTVGEGTSSIIAATTTAAATTTTTATTTAVPVMGSATTTTEVNSDSKLRNKKRPKKSTV